MMSILDRYILRTLAINYAIALAVMLSLYVLLDLFINIDEFVEQRAPLPRVLANMFDYYWPNLLLYFSQLSGVITLFACLAAVARMRKFNEMSAILASGVSLYRVARPILAFGVATTGLQVVATEWLIPQVAHRLARDHDDVEGLRAYEVFFVRDLSGDLISAARFLPESDSLQQLLVLSRDADGTLTKALEADRADWRPPDATRPRPYWKLERGRIVSRAPQQEGGLGPREEKILSYPTVYETTLGPREIQVRQADSWARFLSLGQLRELASQDTPDRAGILRLRHARVVAPIVSVVLLMLGLPFFLDRSPANVLGDAGRCMIVCGLCYVAAFVSQSIRSETQPALYAWLPIFVFGTVAIVLFDRVKT